MSELKRKDVLGLRDWTADEIQAVFDMVPTMRSIREGGGLDCMKGHRVVTLFFENSTRTRISFEAAASALGAEVVSVAVAQSSSSKGESLIDTAKTLEAVGASVVVLRHSVSGTPHLLAQQLEASVINAGDGMNEHPTQALLDLYTIYEKKGRIKGLKVAITGDIAHSRVARSNIWALRALGAQVTVGGPATLLPPGLDRLGVCVYESAHEAIIDADVIIGLRMQTERQTGGLLPSTGEYARFYGIEEKRLLLAAPDVILLHPGPVNRGVEMSSEVVDGERSMILRQVTNGVLIRMALMKLLTERR